MKPTLLTLAAVFFAATSTSARAATSSDELSFESTPAKSAPVAKPLPFDTIPARGGVIKITPIFHASIQIEYRGKVILVDPISAGSYRKKADVILITHSHPDHLDFKAINRVVRNETPVVAPKSADFQSVLPTNINGWFPNFVYLKNGVTKIVAGFPIQAVPAYNIKRGPDATHKFHPKGAFNGYILTLGGKRIYIAGDTEATPEMKALKNIDAAFVPMNLPYTMTPQEAAVGVRAFKPKIVYPYHFRYPFNVENTNPQQFAYALRDTKIKVRVLDWYNAAPVARFMAAAKAKN